MLKLITERNCWCVWCMENIYSCEAASANLIPVNDMWYYWALLMWCDEKFKYGMGLFTSYLLFSTLFLRDLLSLSALSATADAILTLPDSGSVPVEWEVPAKVSFARGNVSVAPWWTYQPLRRQQKNQGARDAGSRPRSPWHKMMRTHWCCWWQCLDLAHKHTHTHKLLRIFKLFTKFLPLPNLNPSNFLIKLSDIFPLELISHPPVLKVHFSLRPACCCCAGNSLLTFLITTLL